MTPLAPLRRAGLAAATLILTTLALANAALAQSPGFDLFNLFGGNHGMQQRAPSYPGYGRGYGYGYGYGNVQPQQDDYYQRPRRRSVKRKPVEPAQQREAAPKEAAAPPKNASTFVYVFGDTLGQLLGSGLEEAYATRADIGIVSKARGPSGLVASSAFDWPKTIDDLLAGRDVGGKSAAKDGAKDTANDARKTGDAPKAPKIDVAVMMIGANDRQPIEIDGKTLQPGTPDWKAAYTKRVMAIDDAFRAKKVPLIWVGVPITKDDDFADAMAGLNDIYREAAAKTGATYVDTWEAFSDDDGDFSAYGPDINGQTVRLRSADGVNFTKAGGRKLAHFVEAHISRALDGKAPAPQLPTAPAPDAKAGDAKVGDAKPGDGKGAKTTAAVRPEIGPIRNLNELPSAASGTLVTYDPKGAKSGDATSEIAHAAAVAPATRADNAKWSGKSLTDP